MKKILCPTDFSDAAHNAIAYAAKFAQVYGFTLTLLHVQSLVEMTDSLLTGSTEKKDDAAAILEAQCQEIRVSFKVSCYAEVHQSIQPLSAVIHQIGAGYDLIIMGTDGPDNLYQYMLGTKTYDTIKKATTPVLLIPEGLMYSTITNMVYAFDLLHNQHLPMRSLEAFIATVKCKITILQVLNEHQDESETQELLKLKSTYLHESTQPLDLSFDTIQSSTVAQSINTYTLRNNADALALCFHHRNFINSLLHKSVIKTLSHISQYPIFVFHE